MTARKHRFRRDYPARYREYRVDEEIAYESEESSRLDGRRFYWDIQLQEPPADTATPAAERPDYQANKHRIFAYDGNAYTRYYKSADYAVVVMNQDEMPMQLFGPFSAGVVPWGSGAFSSSKLPTRSPVAVEYQENGQTLIRLSLTDVTPDITYKTVIVLDPAKQYAPRSYTMQTSVSSIRHVRISARPVNGDSLPLRYVSIQGRIAGAGVV